MTHIEKMLAEAVDYDADTGVLTWRCRPVEHFSTGGAASSWNKRFSGKPAFAAKHVAGYLHGAFSGRHFLAHRVAWFVEYGVWPEEEIDHISGVRSDNRLANLREATRAQNVANNAAQRGKKSKYKGVTQVQSGRWGAYMNEWLGTFPCETAAAVARAKAERAIYGAFVRPNCGVA